MRQDAAKLVSSALLGIDVQKVKIGGKEYEIQPPTIKKIVGAGYYLADFGKNEKKVQAVINQFDEFEKIATAMSWFIKGDESLTKDLMEGTLNELLDGIQVAFSAIGIANFARLSTLARNVKRAIAKQR